jgi:hypothetical protein
MIIIYIPGASNFQKKISVNCFKLCGAWNDIDLMSNLSSYAWIGSHELFVWNIWNENVDQLKRQELHSIDN